MRFRNQKSHMIDFLFPIALFFVFALSAIAVILFATDIYRSATEHSSLNYTAGTSLSYISEKIHQNDEKGNVTLGTFEGMDALIIEQDFDGISYFTYIYTAQNELKELFVKEGVKANAAAGKSIVAVKSFTMEKLDDNAFRFSCIDDKNQTASSIVTTKTTK